MLYRIENIKKFALRYSNRIVGSMGYYDENVQTSGTSVNKMDVIAPSVTEDLYVQLCSSFFTVSFPYSLYKHYRRPRQIYFGGQSLDITFKSFNMEYRKIIRNTKLILDHFEQLFGTAIKQNKWKLLVLRSVPQELSL